MEHVFLINPRAGRGNQASRIYAMAEALRRRGLSCRCLLTDRPGRAEELVEIGLDVPHATELALALKKQGLPLPEGIYTHEQLLSSLLELKGVASC